MLLNTYLHWWVKRERGREAREGGMHRCRQNVIKCTAAPTGSERERGREVREGGVHRHKLKVGMPVSPGKYARLTTCYMVMFRGPRDLIHEYRL